MFSASRIVSRAWTEPFRSTSGSEPVGGKRRPGRLSAWLVWLRVFALALIVLCTAGVSASTAQPTPNAAGEQDGMPNRAEIRRLIRTLEDDKARAQLVGQLRALIAVQDQKEAERPGIGARMMTLVSERMDAIGAGFVQIGEQLSRPDVFLAWLEVQARSPERRAFWARVFATLAGVFAAAALIDFVVERLLAQPRRALEHRLYENAAIRFGAALLRAVLDLVPIAAFAAAGYGVLTLTDPSRNVRLVALAVLNAAIAARLLTAAVRLLLTPLAPNLRLIPVGDDMAAYAFIWARRFIVIGIYGYFAGQVAMLLGFSAAGREALMKLLGLLVAVMAVILVLQLRARVADAIRGDHRESRPSFAALRRRMAEIWHVLVMILIFAAYFAWALAIRGGFAYVVRGLVGTLAVIGVARLLVLLERRAIGHLFSISQEMRLRYPTLEERASRYVPIARGLVTALIVVMAGIFVLQVWGVDALHAFRTQTGRTILLGAFRILFIVVLALAVIEAAGILITRYLEAADQNGHTRPRSARARTLLPLVRNVIAILVGTVAVISVLGQLGVDIAPLIAGVGIFGLAVGFGAQSLVKDVITGAFILFEDAIAVGDVIEVAGHSGTVEALSIRSVRMRDLSGHVSTVPFGAIDAVKNRTKEFAYYMTDVGVGYREDPDEVAAAMREIGKEMQEDPAYSAAILAPLEVMGVQQLGDYSVAIRVRIKTNAPDQWRIGREFNRRLKKTFDARDIELPFPSHTVYFGAAKDGSAAPGHLLVAPEPQATPQPDKAAAPSATPDAHPPSMAGEGGGTEI